VTRADGTASMPSSGSVVGIGTRGRAVSPAMTAPIDEVIKRQSNELVDPRSA
jgi:hypothetical protein